MSSIINNDPEQVRIRRNRNTISIIGIGVAAFGIWTIIKSMMELLFGDLANDLLEIIGDVPYWFKVLVITFTVIVIIGEVLLRVFIGARCIKYGRGKTDSQKYLFPAFLIASLSLYSLIYSVYRMTYRGKFTLNNYANFFVELTSFFLLVELFILSIDNRILESREKKKAVKNAD